MLELPSVMLTDQKQLSGSLEKWWEIHSFVARWTLCFKYKHMLPSITLITLSVEKN